MKLQFALAGLVLAISLAPVAPSSAQAQTITTNVNAEQIAALQAQINALLAQIQAYGGVKINFAGVVPTGFRFRNDLKLGMTGDNVYYLHKMLNASTPSHIAASGPNSNGNETYVFAGDTFNAVVRFQELYRSEILTPIGLVHGTGFVGAYTRNKLNGLIEGNVSMTPQNPCGACTTVPTPANNSNMLMLSAAAQAPNSTAPAGALKLPFVRFTVTAPANQSVNFTGVNVERQGSALNSSVAGVMLLDDQGNQIGGMADFKSSNQVVIGSATTIPAGGSRTFSVVGNVAASTTDSIGKQLNVALVGINTQPSVMFTGTLPIAGTMYTVQ